MQYTEEQILAFAPDESSKKSGRQLATPAKWMHTGANNAALWGECKGSGSKPYQTQIDQNNLAFKCSCPSRKFPCKHGLGLLLLYVQKPDMFTETTAPQWVEEWLQKRVEKEQKKDAAPTKEVNPEQQAKRLQKRTANVDAGLAELELWIKDTLRNGILSLPEKGAQPWEAIAKRLIDAQAPGVARIVRSIGAINFFREGWQSLFLEQVLRCVLLLRAYSNREVLSEEMRQEVLSLVGFHYEQTQLHDQPSVRDTWFVMGVQTSTDEQLIAEHTWLYGTNTRQYALLLQFYVQSQPPSFRFMPSTVVDADIVYYPAAVPLRAAVKNAYTTANCQSIPEGYSTVVAVCERERDVYCISPFPAQLPCILHDLVPVRHGEQWLLRDTEEDHLVLRAPEDALWRIVAVAGGKPHTFSLVGSGCTFEPLGMWQEGRYIAV